MKLSPMNDRVLVRAEEQQTQTAGGIFLPGSSQDAPQWGTIVSVGPGAVFEGRRVEPTVKTGDKVLFGKYSGTKVKLDEEEMLFMREEDILAIVES